MEHLEQNTTGSERYASVPFTLAFPSSSPLVVASNQQMAPFEARQQEFFADMKLVQSASTTSPTGTSHSTAVATDSHSGGQADDTTTDSESDPTVDQSTDD